MGTRIIDDGEYAVLYDSVTMTAFGPVVYSDDVDLVDFLNYLRDEGYDDPRSLSHTELEVALADYREEREEAHALYEGAIGGEGYL